MSTADGSPLDPLDPSEWGRVESILDDVLDRPEAERDARLASTCGGDARLRAAVDRLLAADRQAGAFLERPIVETVPDLFAPPPEEGANDGAPPEVGRCFGSWRIVREVGRGGMGTVFEAVREGSDFEQHAALKLIRRGLDTDEILERFRRERRILASLQHPNIARLLDGGASDDGRPWFAMEFVEGEPITQWCDARRLGVEERVRLLLAACDALQHAHRSLVVHRDLKPGNILVSNAGEVKLLDFGVARLLSAEGADADVTAIGARGSALTPRYASPEQVRGEPATTATDVYGLGLVLYELLSGRRAHVGDTESFEALARMVLEREPETPSDAATRDTGGALRAAEVAAQRGTDPVRLRQQLLGDLDAIVRVALAKDPGDRYASVEALAEDLRRHLGHAPVRARSASRSYRIGKFVARHGVALAGAALALVVLAGWAGTLSVSLDRQRRAREAAEVSAREAKRTRDFLAAMIATGGLPRYSSFAPLVGSTSPDVRLRDVLDRAAREVDPFFAREPRARLAMHVTLGDTYRAIGVFDSALVQLAAADQLAESLGDTKGIAIANDLLYLLNMQIGRADSARGAIARSEVAAFAGFGPRSREYALALTRFADLLVRDGQPDSGLARVTRALEIGRAIQPPDSGFLMISVDTYGRALDALGRSAEAEAPMRAALGWSMRQFPSEHVNVLAGKGNLAKVLLDNGKPAEAEQLYREVVATRRAHMPGSVDLANTVNALAMLLREQKRYAEAESAFVEAIAIRARRLGADNRTTLASRTGLAIVYQRTGRAREAIRVHREILELRRRSLGPDHALVGSTLFNLGEATAEAGRLAEAERWYREALTLRRRTLSYGHPDTRKAVEALAALYERQGRPELADATRASAGR